MRGTRGGPVGPPRRVRGQGHDLIRSRLRRIFGIGAAGGDRVAYAAGRHVASTTHVDASQRQERA